MPRIRLQSCAPLPALKAWFLLSDNIANILDLKVALCSQLSILKDTNCQPAQLTLEVDDFEVLDESPVDLVREADIIKLKQRTITEMVTTLKRKFDGGSPAMSEPKRSKLPNKAVPPAVPASSNTSSTSSSDTSSSSSSSSSDTDSDVSTSSDSAPSVAPSKRRQPLAKGIIIPVSNKVAVRSAHQAQMHQPTVPPGFGKPSTQSRNKRRKIRRQFAAGKGPSDIISTSTLVLDRGDDKEDNIIDLLYDTPTPGAAVQMTLASTPDMATHAMSSSLGNRNKRKGFKKSMEGVLPQKLVYDSTTALSFTPPSEVEMLPRNIFVTSVDVEWRTGRGRGRGREQDSEEVENALIPKEFQAPQVQVWESEQQVGSVDWTAVEAYWNKYPKIEVATKLSTGIFVAWRGFGLDPVTLTPQASLLHLGKVTALDAENLTVSPLARPGFGHVTFGRAQIEEEAESAEQISTPLAEIWSNDWRVISTNQ